MSMPYSSGRVRSPLAYEVYCAREGCAATALFTSMVTAQALDGNWLCSEHNHQPNPSKEK